MTGLDTNVLTRYFAQDDAAQSKIADAVIDSFTADKPGWISQAVILELVWVFTSSFRANRSEVCQILDSLMSRDDLVLESSDTIDIALELYRRGKADFAGCLIACSGRAAGCTKTLTFDQDAARTAGMTLVS